MAEKIDPIMNGYVAIGASLGGILLVIIALFLIFARTQVALAIPISWAIVVLGIVVAAFATKAVSVKRK